MRKKQKRRQRRIKKPEFCALCQEGYPKNVDYKDVLTLGRFITRRSKVVSRSRSGLCAKHQRGLAVAIKRARIMALLPFVS